MFAFTGFKIKKKIKLIENKQMKECGICLNRDKMIELDCNHELCFTCYSQVSKIKASFLFISKTQVYC